MFAFQTNVIINGDLNKFIKFSSIFTEPIQLQLPIYNINKKIKKFEKYANYYKTEISNIDIE